MLIIDALRYDFIAPPAPASSGNWTPNPYYHNVLSLPAELTAKQGSASSFLAHFTADPPTTTLQRLKGLTTGTLPTFVEAGANFGSAGTGIGKVNEDNWIAQFKSYVLSGNSEGKAGFVFAGDETWSTVFPGLFDNDTTWSYDSFNVEDLDTVDRGVEDKLLPFLQRSHPERKAGVHDSWRLLVGHTLGVDHVGHRFGASHPKMATKLGEMQAFLKNVTDALDDETVLVLMGDHGMDERGDHGGDAELEVGAGLWIYSKTGFASSASSSYFARQSSLGLDLRNTYLQLKSKLFCQAASLSPRFLATVRSRRNRSVPQIDLVPTLSLLLGLPIPYNNLGSPIPDVFPNPSTLLRALRITSIQLRTYLNTYSAHSPDLAAFKPEFDSLWLAAIRADAELAAASKGEVEAKMRKLVKRTMRSTEGA